MFRRSTDDVTRINFHFRFWSGGHFCLVVLHVYSQIYANIFIQYGYNSILRNSIWRPSVSLNLLVEVVGPPKKPDTGWWLSRVKTSS